MADIPTPPGVLTDEEFDQIQAAGGPAAAPPELQSFYLAHVNQYNAFRSTHPREKDREAMAKRLSALDDLALDPDATAKRMQLDSILTAPPDQQAAAKDALLVDAHIQERLRRRTVISGSVWDAGRPPDQLAVDRDAARDALAVEVFGETAPRGSDAAVAAKLREAAQGRRNMAWLVGGKDGTDEQSRKINEASMARWATRAGLAGESATAAFAAWKEQAKASPAWTAEADSREMWPAFAQQYQDARSSAEPLRKKVAPVFEKLLALSQSDTSPAMAVPAFLEAVAPIEDIDLKTLRQVVLPMIRAMAESRKDQDGRDMWAKIEESFRRPISRALGASWDTVNQFLQGSATQEFPQEGLSEEMAAARADTKRRTIAHALLRSVASESIDPILTTAKTKAGKMAEQMVYDVAGSLGYMAMSAIPYAGFALNTAGFADDNVASLLNANPTMDPNDAALIGWGVAPLQAAVENLQRLGLQGKLPGFNRAMNRLAGPAASPVMRFALYGAAATGIEYTEEIIQQALPLAGQSILAALKEDVPHADWDGFDAFDLRTLLAVAPLALIGAGVNVARDSAATRALMSNEEAMRAVGMSEDAIDKVMEAPTVAAKVDALREGYASRDPAKEPDVEWRQTAFGKVTKSELDAAEELADDVEAAQVRVVHRETGAGFTVIDSAGTKYQAATEEEARQIVAELANGAAEWSQIKPIVEVTDLLDQRADAPTTGSRTTMQGSMVVSDIIEQQMEIVNDASLNGRIRVKARKFVRNLMNRVAIFEQMEGKPADLKRLRIAGQSMTEVRNGVATAVVMIGMGADAHTVLEERFEADVTALLMTGQWTTDGAAQMVRQVEERMNRNAAADKQVTFLAGYTDGKNRDMDELAVKEAISRLGQIYVTGRTKAARQGAAIPQYFKQYRKATRARLKEAEAEGIAPSIFEYLRSRVEWMKTALGQAIRLNRAIREARAAGEPLAIEEFLQRITGIAPQVEAAKEVEQQADQIFYVPPELRGELPDDIRDNMAFSLQLDESERITPDNPVAKTIAGTRAADVFASAKKRFGLTTSLYEAGYVLPDGTLLDFSGRSQADGFTQGADLVFRSASGRDYMKDQRGIDHREIEWDEMPDYPEAWHAMTRFLSLGAIRIDGNSGMISMHSRAKPTAAQLSILKALVISADGAYVDLEDDLGNRASLSLESGKFGKVQQLLTRWAAGETPDYSGPSFNLQIDEATELPLNPDGTVTLYHGTTAQAAEDIKRTKLLKSAAEPDVYLTTAREGTGYGDGTVIAVDIPPRLLILDDEFPDGRKDFRVHVGSKRFLPIRISRFAPPDSLQKSGASFSLTEDQFDENRDRYLPSDYFEPFQKTPAPEDGQTVRTEGDLSAVVIPWGIMYAVRNGVTIGAIDGGSVQVAEDEQRKGVGLFLLQAWEAHTGKPMRLGSHTVAGRNLFERYWANKAGGASFSLTEMDTKHADLERRAKAGDAEATAEAQAMVDQAAKRAGWWVRLLHHGTQKTFRSFSASKTGTRNDEGRFGRGFYFTSSKYVAAVYAGQNPFTKSRDINLPPGGIIHSVYLNLKNPKTVNAKDVEMPQTPEEAEAITQQIISEGYDGVIGTIDGNPDSQWTEFVVFSPSQIKSADPFTYDEAGNLIPLSKRFDAGRSDISFSLTEEELERLRRDLEDPATESGTPAEITLPATPEILNPQDGDEIDWSGASFSLTTKGNAPILDPDAFPVMDEALAKQLAAKTDGISVLHMDRMRVGKYLGIPLQGGMGYAAIRENTEKSVVWAVNRPQVALELYDRARKTGGLVALVLMEEGNLVGNKTFTRVWFEKLRRNIAAKKVTKETALAELNRVRMAQPEQSGHTKEWKTLKQAEADIIAMAQQPRAELYFQRAGQGTYAKLLGKKMVAAGLPDPLELVKNMEEPAFDGLRSSGIVGFIRLYDVDPSKPVETAADAGVTPHISYNYIVRGEPVARARNIIYINDIRPEHKGKLITQGMSQYPVEETLLQSFSLQPDAMLDNLATQVGTTMNRAPQARLEMVGRAKDNLAALKDSFLRGRTGGFTPERSVASLQSEQDMRQAVREQELLQAAGVSLTSAQDIRIGRADAYRAELANQLAARGVEEKSPQRIRREANFRQALEREKMLAQTDEDYSRSLSQIYRDFGFWDGTVMTFLSRKTKGTRTGILMSYRKAQRFAGKGEFVNHGPWDGSEELPRILFSGTTQPDVAAMELFSAHPEVFPAGTTAADVTPDMMWDAISRELAENEKLAGVWDDYQKAVRATKQQAKEWGDAWVENYRRQLAEARAEAERAGNAYVAEATGNNAQAMAAAAQARQEAAEWRKRADRWQAADWNDKAVLTRAMRTLDAILAAFPPDIRGKVGGWLSLARLGSAESMAKEIGRRIEMLDRELEKSLRADAIEQIRDLIERAKPKREGGKKPTGKIGAAAHRYFDAVASVVDMSATEVEAMRLALDTELAAATTPEQQADIWEKQQILDTFGGLEAKDAAGVPLHDAADLEAALAQAQQVYITGRNYWRTIEEARLADIAAKTAATAAAMPAVKVQALLAQGDAAKRISGMLKNTSLSLRSFREILKILLGRGNPLAQQWADMAMDAMHQRTDDMRKLSRRWFDAARKSTKLNRQKTEDALWNLITARTVAVTLRPGQPVAERIPIERIPNMAALGYNAQEIADAEAAFDALPLDTTKEYVEIERWQPGSEEPVELTQAEAIYISMLAAQTQYASPLARAGWGTETMQELEAALSPLAKDMRSFMADEYREGYYPLASLFEGMFGVSLPQIENYAPGKWWSRGAEKAMDPTQAGLVEGGFRAGFLKNRKAHQAAPKVANAFEVFFGHANQTAHWRAMAPLARELRAVFADPGIKQQITAAHGPEMLATVNRWLESLEGNGLQVGYSQAYQNLLSWQATVALAWKVGTLMKQSTAMLGSAFKIPLRAYMRGMGRFIRGKLDVQDIWESDMIQRRVESGFSPEVRLAVAKTMTAKPTRREHFLRQGMELIGYVDAAFTTISAAIAYDYHLEQAKAAGLSEAAAKRQAMSETQRIVTMTAQPVEVTDRSLFEQTGWGKMLLMFGGDSRQKASMWVTALAAAIKGKATPDDIRVLAISHLIIGPMLQVITSAWMDWRDDDDDEIFDEKNWEAWDMARSVLLGPAAGLPLIREIVDDFSGDNGPLAATGKAAADAVAIVKGPTDSEDEKVEWYGKRIAGVLKGLSAFPAVLAGIGDQVFRVSDNLIETDDEIRAKIQTLQRKLEREKDREEQDALRERILGLQSKLK